MMHGASMFDPVLRGVVSSRTATRREHSSSRYLVGRFFYLQGGDVQVHQVRATRSPLVETSMGMEQDGQVYSSGVLGSGRTKGRATSD